ncbi:MAG: phosphatidylserine decarboxylase [Armatimonadetes bacterium]|nr:MAG: phosphatidylserine decarboxylase [Armatimonadota bacterium]
MALFFLGTVALIAAVFLFLRTVWFHRDPKHPNVPQDDEAVRSPVYGIVAYVREVKDGVVLSEKKGETIRIDEITKEETDGGGYLIGIAMTALDVHYQYAPMPAVVERYEHKPAQANLPMFDFWEYVRITYFRRWVQLWAKRYLLENERQTFWLQGSQFRLALVLIADKFVSKIQTLVSPGSQVQAGDKLSFIGRGSQVDVFLPMTEGVDVLVQPGDRVCGPMTVLARVNSASRDSEASGIETAALR